MPGVADKFDKAYEDKAIGELVSAPVSSRVVGPTAFITQREAPTSAIEAYESFDRPAEGWLKTVLEVT